MILDKASKIMEYVHATMLLALFVPVLYAVMGGEMPAAATYGKCLLVAVPVVVADQAAKRVRGLWLYLAICAVLLAAIGGVAGVLPCIMLHRNALESRETCYCAGMLLETLFVEGLCFNERLSEAKRRKGGDPFAAAMTSFLHRPALSMVAYFAIIYGAGILLCSKALCDMAFISAIVYFFMVLVYLYLEAIRHYLSLNKRTKGIPIKRLYGIGAVMLVVFCVFAFAAVFPSILLAGQRQYYVNKTLLDGMELPPLEFENGGAAGGMELGFPPELLDGQPPKEPSKVLIGFFRIFAIACTGCLIYSAIRLIRQVFKDFRNSFDENGDRIEELEDEKRPYREEAMRPKFRRGYESEAQRIRRRYRRMIHRHRKERPAPYESPAEIEELAGLRNEVEMQALHKLYEKARYGPPKTTGSENGRK